MKYTIKDIALLCGVGKSTVSRVLNHDPKVNAQTREKVQKIIDSLGFEPNRNARTMRGIHSPVVGIIVTRLNSFSESQTLNTILTTLYQHKIIPLIVESHFQPQLIEQHFQLFRQNHVTGIILFGFSEIDPSLFQQWNGALVTIARCYPNINAIYYDDHNAIMQLMQYLHQKGHHQIGYLGVNAKDQTTGKARTQSYLNFCHQHQLTPHWVSCELNTHSAYEHISELLAKPISALLCASSSLAIGALKYLQEAHISLPLAYIGQNPILQSFFPEAINLDFGHHQAGEWAVELLLNQLNGTSQLIQRKLPCRFSPPQ